MQKKFIHESTHCIPSTRCDSARNGIIAATCRTTSLSLLYACPQILRISIRTNPTTKPSMITMDTVTQTARQAACALPAPSSFDTRVLQENEQEKKIYSDFSYITVWGLELSDQNSQVNFTLLLLLNPKWSRTLLKKCWVWKKNRTDFISKVYVFLFISVAEN